MNMQKFMYEIYYNMVVFVARGQPRRHKCYRTPAREIYLHPQAASGADAAALRTVAL